MPNYFLPMKRKEERREFKEPETTTFWATLLWREICAQWVGSRGAICTLTRRHSCFCSRRIIDLWTAICSRLCLAISFDGCPTRVRPSSFPEVPSNLSPWTDLFDAETCASRFILGRSIDKRVVEDPDIRWQMWMYCCLCISYTFTIYNINSSRFETSSTMLYYLKNSIQYLMCILIFTNIHIEIINRYSHRTRAHSLRSHRNIQPTLKPHR